LRPKLPFVSLWPALVFIGFASKVRSNSLFRSVPFVLLRVISWIVLASRKKQKRGVNP
jgi:hypothetical protein